MQYDRIDPAEMQQLKDEIAQLQAQNAEFKEAAEKQSQETAAQLARVCETLRLVQSLWLKDFIACTT